MGIKLGKVVKKVLPVAARVVGTIYGGPAGGAIAGGVADAVCGKNKKADGNSNPLGAVGGILNGNGSNGGGSALSSLGSIFGNGNSSELLGTITKGLNFSA